MDLLLPELLRESHREHVGGYFAAPRTRVMGLGLNLLGRRKDGSEFPVEVSLTYAKGTPRGDLVVATAIDITQRLALEREARKAETITSLGTIAVGIAHELNQPLGAILNNSQAARRLLAAKRPDLAEVKAAIEEIIKDNSRAVDIVRNVRALFQRDEAQMSSVGCC